MRTEKFASKIQANEIILFLIYFLSLFTVINPLFTRVISSLSLILIIIIFYKKCFYYVVPLLIFFGRTMELPFGVNVFDLYVVLFLFNVIMTRNIRLNSKLIIPMLLFITYSILVVLSRDFRTGIIIILTTVFLYFYISLIERKEILLNKFIEYFIYATILAGTFGFLTNSVVESIYNSFNNSILISRNIGTFTDPNHYGFFLNIAILSKILNMLYKKISIKDVVIVFILYLLIFSTVSITGLLCNFLGLLFIMIFARKTSRLKKLCFSILIIILPSFLLLFAVMLNLSNVLDVLDRLKFIEESAGNLSIITSNRSVIWEKHINLFLNQSNFRILFGGNFITDYGFDNIFSGVSHQAFIDMILNFGIIGSFVFLFSFIYNLHYIFFRSKLENFEKYSYLIIKYVWIFYAFLMSMYPAWIFQFFFFV